MPPRRPSRILIALVALLAVLALPTTAQAPIDVAGYGPPDWVTAGTRITGYAAAAAVGGSRYQLIEDPEGPYIDRTTGKHYRKTDENNESLGGASGDGYYEIDVIAVEGRDVVVSQTLYVMDRTFGILNPQPAGGWRQPGGALEGVWTHPDFLATLQTGDVAGVLVLQGPYELNGTTYDTVNIVNAAAGSYSSHSYDRPTGLLIASTTRASGQTSPVQLPGQGVPVTAGAWGISRFTSTRQLAMPGIATPVPGWVTRTPALRYAGTTTITNTFDPSLVVRWPTQATVTFPQVGATWATYELRTVTDAGGVQSPGGQDGVASGTGLFWWAPDALAAMTQGQVLDSDPVTGLQVTVGSVGNGPAGPTVDIESQMPGTTGRVTYDVGTGVLLRYQVQTQSNGTTIDLSLQAMP